MGRWVCTHSSCWHVLKCVLKRVAVFFSKIPFCLQISNLCTSLKYIAGLIQSVDALLADICNPLYTLSPHVLTLLGLLKILFGFKEILGFLWVGIVFMFNLESASICSSSPLYTWSRVWFYFSLMQC